MTKRLDVVMVERSLVSAREKAKDLINNKQVLVNNKVCTKASMIINEDANIEITGEVLKYVSRGGLKLEKAIDCFNLMLDGKICGDIGASTGGFTHCMLLNHADKVYSVDVGHSQLHESLVNNEKVVNLEGINVRNLTENEIKDKLQFISVDVSFISLKLVLPYLYKFLSEDGEMVCLIKPQFEVGKSNIGKKGVVKSIKAHKEVIVSIIEASKTVGYGVKGITFSPIKGPEGNIEYLLYLTYNNDSVDIDINSILDQTSNFFSK